MRRRLLEYQCAAFNGVYGQEDDGGDGSSMSVTKDLYAMLDTWQERDITGWELQRIMYERTGRNTYPSTLLKKCREYADMTGAEFKCTCPSESRYHFVPGFGIGKNSYIGG